MSKREPCRGKCPVLGLIFGDEHREVYGDTSALVHSAMPSAVASIEDEPNVKFRSNIVTERESRPVGW